MWVFVSIHNSPFRYSEAGTWIKDSIHTHKLVHTRVLPFEQPLVDGGQCEHLEQQPDGQREEDQRERLHEEVEPNVKQRTGQLLQRETDRE